MRFQKFALLTIAPYILAVLALPSCFSSESAPPPQSKFHFGDKVYILEGFYQGSRGRIRSCYYINHQQGFICEVDAQLTSSDGQYNASELMRFNENDLVKDVSDN